MDEVFIELTYNHQIINSKFLVNLKCIKKVDQYMEYEDSDIDGSLLAVDYLKFPIHVKESYEDVKLMIKEVGKLC